MYRDLRTYFRTNLERMTTFLTAVCCIELRFSRSHHSHYKLTKQTHLNYSSVSSVRRVVAIVFLAKHRRRCSSQPLLHRPSVPPTDDV